MPVCAERRGPKGEAEVESGKGIMGNVDMSDNQSRDRRMELTGQLVPGPLPRTCPLCSHAAVTLGSLFSGCLLRVLKV